jgi:GNAT superfamily N-acetyltransferase
VIRAASTIAHRDAARALLDEYLRLPDAWPDGRSPARLPGGLARYLHSFPRPADQYPHGHVLLASVAEEAAPQGLLVLNGLSERTAHLSRLYVQPSARGRGLARELVEGGLVRARIAGCKAAALDVLPFREPALELYRSCGFVIVDPSPASLCRRTFMELELPVNASAVATLRHRPRIKDRNR